MDTEKEIEKIDEFLLPTELSIPTENMESCVLYGLPKCGKTTILSQLSNCLIIDTENGSGKVKGLIKKIPMDRGPVAKMQWLEKFAAILIAKGKPYDYVALDTLSEVNDLSEWSGTYRYMNSSTGISFNRELDERGIPIKRGKMLPPTHPNYESVHSLPEGYGYKWSREDTMRIFEKYMKVAKKCVFFICHVEDKFIGPGDTRIALQQKVVPKQLALTGKVRDIVSRKVDAIGYVYNDGGVIKVNFTGNEERVGGNRAPHLRGYNDILDWNKLFI